MGETSFDKGQGKQATRAEGRASAYSYSLSLLAPIGENENAEIERSPA